MTPFPQFRTWLRESPAGERLVVAVSGLLVLVLVGWALVPEDDPDTSSVEAAAPRPTPVTAGTPGAIGDGDRVQGAEPTDAGVVNAATSAAAAVPSGPVAGGAAPSGAAPDAPAASVADAGCDARATDRGVTAKEILVGVVFPSLGEANPALGIPPAENQRKMYQALFDRVNAQGGVQCRKLVPRFYEDFVLSAESGRAACLSMQEDGVFVVLNNLFRPEARNCPMQAKIPTFWYTSPDTESVRQFHPYLLGFTADYDRLIRDYVQGVKQLGFFDGMAKLGLLEQTCYPARVRVARDQLASVGVPRAKISSYNYGCPGTLATPEQHTAAALQFRRDGVTHVMSVYREGPSDFAEAASQQGFAPKYAFMDDQFISLANNANPPWTTALDGALIITKGQEGAERTPGTTFSAATQECAAVTKSLGFPPPTQPGRLDAPLYGNSCAQVKLFAAAAEATRPLTRAGLAAGQATVGKLDLAFPAGPGDFRSAENPTGNHFWRTARFFADCRCVRLLDAAWRAEFR